MAKISRHIGLKTQRAGLPTQASIGPALLHVGKTGQAIAQERGAEKAAGEAQLAAAQLNFERDEEGNLLEPSLPVGSNGLIAPTIYDQAYTDQVFTRYRQQSQIDASAQITSIASKFKFDPDGFQEVAEGYINKITDLAPAQLKGEINLNAQVKMVEHYNYITRQTAQRDYDSARATYVETITDTTDSIISGIMAGEDMATTLEKYALAQELVANGVVDRNFFTEAQAQEHMDSLDVVLSGAMTMKAANDVPDNMEDLGAAMADALEMENGEGNVTVIRDGKPMVMPIREAYPNPADQQAIAKASQDIIKNKSLATAGRMNAEHSQETIDYVMWYAPHRSEVMSGRVPFNMAKADRFLGDAIATKNTVLAEKILADKAQAMSGSGATTAAQSYNAGLAQIMGLRAREHARADLKIPRETMSPEDQVRRDIQVAEKYNFSVEQTAANQREVADALFDNYVANNEGFDPFDAPWHEVKAYFDLTVKGTGDLIPSAVTRGLNNTFSNVNDNIDSFDRGLAIAYEFIREPGTRRNLKAATSPAVFKALDYVFSTRAPGEGNINANEVSELIEKFGDPSWSPHPEWNDKSDEEVTDMMTVFEEQLQAYLVDTNPWWGDRQGTQVSKWARGLDFRILGETLSEDIPHKVKVAMFNNMKANSGGFNGTDKGQIAIAMRNSMKQVLDDFGYAPSRFGFDRNRAQTDEGFFGNGRADYALVRTPPEYWYRQDGLLGSETGSSSPTDQHVMAEIEKEFASTLEYMSSLNPGSPKYIANETAWLEFDQDHFDDTNERRFTIKLVDVDRDFTISDALDERQGVLGNIWTIDFEANGAVERGYEVSAQARIEGIEREKRIREKNQEIAVLKMRDEF